MQVKDIIVKGQGQERRAAGVQLADGRVFRGKAVISNATRWDTFEKLLAQEEMPASERLFRHGHCPVSDYSLCSSHGLPQPCQSQHDGRSQPSDTSAPPLQGCACACPGEGNPPILSRAMSHRVATASQQLCNKTGLSSERACRAGSATRSPRPSCPFTLGSIQRRC